MMADFLFLHVVAIAFRGVAFGYGHRSSGVCPSDYSGDALHVDAADNP